jgi:hypothetical protein
MCDCRGSAEGDYGWPVGGGGRGVSVLVVSKGILRVSRSGRTTDEHGMLLHYWHTSVLEARCFASGIHQGDSRASVSPQSCATSKPSTYSKYHRSCRSSMIRECYNLIEKSVRDVRTKNGT